MIADGKLVGCQCDRVDAAARALAYSELPEGAERLTFEALVIRPHLSEIVETCKTFAAGQLPEKWLALVGSVGWGKTHLATAIANYRIHHLDLPRAKFATAPGIMRDLKKGFDHGDYETRMDRYIAAPLLVIDDLGAEYHRRGDDGGSWAGEQLFEILDGRYRRRAETVVTSNKPLNELPDRLVDRILDEGSGLCKPFARDLPSYRTGEVRRVRR